MSRLRVTAPMYPIGSKIHCGTMYQVDLTGQYHFYRDYDFDCRAPRGRYKRCVDALHPGPPFIQTGPFELVDLKHDSSDPVQYSTYYSVIKTGPYPRYRYDGGFVSRVDPYTMAREFGLSGFLSPLSHSTSVSGFLNLAGYGATGWNRFKPLRPSVNLGESLVEVRETAKMLGQKASEFAYSWKTFLYNKRKIKGSSLKRIGNDWLSINFGWLPFISDLKGVYDTFHGLNSYIEKLRRDNGKWVHCHGTVLKESSGEELVKTKNVSLDRYAMWPNPSGFSSSASSASGQARLYKTESKKAWFSALMRYWIDDISAPKWKLRAFGLDRLTPAMVWELTPWSWLFDYFSNAGDVISNLSSRNEVVAKNACVMGGRVVTIRVEDTVTTSNCTLPKTINFVYEYGVKARQQATPFGFSFTWDTLSPRQQAILAALGMSRLG